MFFAVTAQAEEAKPKKVSFYNDIRPIFQASCHGCHQPAKAKGDYVMTTFAELLKGGDSEEVAVVPGKPDESHLITLITLLGVSSNSSHVELCLRLSRTDDEKKACS